MDAKKPQPIVVIEAANDGRPVRRIDALPPCPLDLVSETPAETVARERVEWRRMKLLKF